MNEKAKGVPRTPSSAISAFASHQDAPGENQSPGGNAANLSPSKAVQVFNSHAGEVIPDMVQGMRALLEMHNSHELMGLCNALCLQATDALQTKASRIQQIFQNHLIDEKGYIKVLSFIWEGTIVEYLRSEGIQLKLSVDPRLAVLNHWRKGRQRGSSHFIPIYVPRTFLPAPTPTPRDERIISFLKEIEDQERNLKSIETAIRKERDFRNVLAFMATIYELRKAEKEGRDYLLEQLRTAQSELMHMENTLTMTSCQLLELDARHEALLKATLEKESALETVDSFYLEMAANEAAMRSHFEDLYWDTRFGSSNRINDLTTRLAATKKELILTRAELERAEHTANMAEKKTKAARDDMLSLARVNDYLLAQLAKAEVQGETHMALALAVGDSNTINNEEAVEIFEWLKQLPQVTREHHRKIDRLMYLTRLLPSHAYCAILENGMMAKNDVNVALPTNGTRSPKRGKAGAAQSPQRGGKAAVTASLVKGSSTKGNKATK